MRDVTSDIVKALRQMIRAVDLHNKKLIQQHDVTVPQLLVLQALRTDLSLNAGALAREVQLSQGTLTDLLIRLEKKGLITRSRSEEDRRKVLVLLTDNGIEVVDRAPSLLHDRFINELNKLEVWERTQILATLQRVAAMMEAEELDAAPMLAPGVLVPDDNQDKNE